MFPCVHCERPLICDACQAAFVPATPEQYEALSRSEATLLCPECQAVLVCHWCKTPYDGNETETDADSGTGRE